MHAHGSLVRGIIYSLVVVRCMVPVVLFAGPALAEESGENLTTMSLDEISRKLENPLTKLWSLTVQENFSVDQGDQVDGTDVSNTLFFQPFLPIPLGEKWMFTARPVFPLVTNSTMSPGEDQRSAHKTGFGDIQMLSLIGPVWNFRFQITPVIPNPFRRSE